MSRFYLTLVALCFSLGVGAQVKIKDLIEFGDEQFRKGDYYYASNLYQQPMFEERNNDRVQRCGKSFGKNADV